MAQDDTEVEPERFAPTVLPSESGGAREHEVGPRRIVVGDRLGRYRVERRLGAGGMGVVYLARDPDLDRLVAIKLLKPELAAGRSRLLREGQAIARLVHPNVVTVFDVGALGDDLFIAMEYVAGTTLRGWLEERPRDWREVLARFVAAGHGLAAAHRAGLIHRDFKPDNVLLGDDGRVVVTDFGLARDDDHAPRRCVDADLDVTRTAGVMGTPAYMAPEQFRDQPLDGRADQFSFCVALWQGLFGVRPFGGDSARSSATELAEAVLAGVIRPPPARHPVPAVVIAALRRGLSVEADGRFASMEALLAALAATPAPGSRRRVWLAGGITVAAIAGLGAVAATSSSGEAGGRTGRGDAVAVVGVGGGRCDLVAGRLATLWNEGARARYLQGAAAAAVGEGPVAAAVADDAARTAEDAAWFDVIAQRFAAAEQAACDRPGGVDPRAATCLGDAVAAFERAIGRGDRGAWPALVDPRGCVAGGVAPLALRELRGALGNIDPSGGLAPDGGRVAFAAGDELRAMIGADGAALPSEALAGVTRVFAWSADGAALLVETAAGVARVELSSGRRTALPWTGEVAAVSDDGTVAARVRDDAFELTSADGRVLAVVDPPGRVTAVAIAPGARRAALAGDAGHRRAGGIEGWYVLTVDLVTGRSARIDLGITGDAGSTMALTWASPDGLVVGGSGERRNDEALWLLELDAEGGLAGPPTTLVPPRTNTIMDLLDVDAAQRRALVVMVDVPSHVDRARGGRVAPVPGLLDAPVRAVDAVAGRLLVMDDQRVARAVAPDGAILGGAAPGDGDTVLYDGALWYARVDAGDVVLRAAGDDAGDPTAAPRELRLDADIPTPELDNFHCAAGDTRRCFVSWLTDDGPRHAVLDGTRFGPGFDVPVQERGLDLSPDGRRALVHTRDDVAAYDIATGELHVLHHSDDCTPESAVWTPSGAAIVYGLDCAGGTTLQLQPARPGAPARVIATFDAELTGLGAIDEDDVVFSTIDYDSRLVLVEGLPLP